MRTFQLNNEQLQSLRRFHREAKKRSAPEAYRINAVILLGTGWSLKETSDALLLDEETLSSYVKKYKEGQLEGLLKMDYQGRVFKLPIEKMVELEEHLKKNLCQTTAQVVAHVYNNYGVLYSRSGMSALLHRLGFTYKKPKLVPVELTEELQEQFIEDLMEFFETKSDKEPILFYDSTHPQYNTLADHGWIKKGAEVFLPSHSARGRVNVSGAIDIEMLMLLQVFLKKSMEKQLFRF